MIVLCLTISETHFTISGISLSLLDEKKFEGKLGYLYFHVGANKMHFDSILVRKLPVPGD